MEQVEYGKKYYRIDSVIYLCGKDEYMTLKDGKEYKTLRGAKAALEKSVVGENTVMYELIEYEYDPDYPGMVCNDRRLLVKDSVYGIYAD